MIEQVTGGGDKDSDGSISAFESFKTDLARLSKVVLELRWFVVIPIHL